MRHQILHHIASIALIAGTAGAQVPSYRVEPIAPFTGATSLEGASDAGHVAGWRVSAGGLRAFVIGPDDVQTILPLPPGHASSAALDVNSDGVVVGAVHTGGLPLDLGEPAIWTPDGQGGYTVTIPQQFSVLNGPLGPMSIQGGQAVAINDAGQIVGWSRFQGFQGGPATLFSPNSAPIDLASLGLNATPRDINDAGVVVGGGVRFDLATSTSVSLGLPPDLPGNVSFVSVIAFAINEAGTTVVAARLATSTPDRWLTYVHTDANGFEPLAPGGLPYVFTGSYALNDRNDVVATGGVWFAAEDVREPGLDPLLEPGSMQWDVNLGFIDEDRRIVTTATTNGQPSIVRLVPTSVGAPVCGPAIPSSVGLPARIRAEGSDWIPSNELRLQADQLPPSTFTLFLASRSLAAPPAVPPTSEGRLCLDGAIGRFGASIQNSGAQGTVALEPDLTSLPTPMGPVAAQPGETWHFQAWFRDVATGGNPTSNFTNAVSVTLR